MKNIFKTLAAVALIALAASCSKDAAEAPAVNGDATVTFSVEMPGIASRATNDGTTATELYYAVYEAGTVGKTDGQFLFQDKQAINLSTTVNLELVADQTYDIVFWAQAAGTHTPNLENKTIAMNYAAAVAGADETRDAFIGFVDNLEIKGSANETVYLKRPFAQLNVALSQGQLAAAEKAGFELKTVTVKTETHTGFSIAEGIGDATGSLQAVEFKAADYKQLDPKTISVNGTTYDWVSFNYVLPALPTDVVDVEIIFTSTTGKTINVPAFTNVPIERNHRTNIVGDLLTDPANFNVVILPGFENDEHVVNDITIVYDSSKSALENGQILFDAIANATNDAVIHLTPGVYMGTDGQTSRYTIKHNITIEGSGEGVILAGQKYGRVLDCEDPAGATFTLKNVTVQTDHVWGAAVYAKNYVTVDMYNVKTVNAGTTAILLDACNQINGVHPGDQKTRVNAYGVTIENGDLVELNANPCNAYPTASVTEAYFNYDSASNIKVVRPQDVCINQGNNLFVNGVAIPVGYECVDGAMVKPGEYTEATDAAGLAEAIENVVDGGTVMLAEGVEFQLPDITGKAITFIGAGDGAQLKMTDNIAHNNENYKDAELYFENLTIIGASYDGAHNGYVQSKKEVYKKCTFYNYYMFAGDEVLVEECTFINEGQYFWTGSSEKITFNKCQFNGTERALKIASVGNNMTAARKVYVNECSFTTQNAVKAALEIDNISSPYEVYVTNSTKNATYPAWYNCKYTNSNKVLVYIDGVAYVSQAAELNAAIAAGATNLSLAAGAYSMPSIGKDVTISGAADAVLTINKPNLTGSSVVTLNGVTVKGSGYSTGMQHCNKVIYNNVKVIGEMCLYGNEVQFNECDFELAGGQYIWTYGAAKASFVGCDFQTAGKAILIYNEGAGASDVTVSGCEFFATAGAKAGAIANQNCAAIEIDNYAKMAHKLTTSGNTYEGGEKFSGEWRIKNYVADAPVTVNGVEYTQIAIDGKLMTKNAQNEVTVL